MRTLCFYGRRELDGSGDFLQAARIIGEAAAREKVAAQVRTSMWPSPPGSPDQALVRMDRASFGDMNVPRQFDLEIVCDTTLAVIPPMGNALLEGGVLFVNTPAPPDVPPEGPRVVWGNLEGMAAEIGGSAAAAFAGAAWGALEILAPELNLLPIQELTPDLEEKDRTLFHEAQTLGRDLLASGGIGQSQDILI